LFSFIIILQLGGVLWLSLRSTQCELSLRSV